MAQLEAQRDSFLPNILKVLNDRISVLQAFSKTSAAHAEEAGTDIFDDSNSVKAIEGELEGLENTRVLETKRKEEGQFHDAVKNNPALAASMPRIVTLRDGRVEKDERREVERRAQGG